jgi:hypothetical protein
MDHSDLVAMGGKIALKRGIKNGAEDIAALSHWFIDLSSTPFNQRFSIPPIWTFWAFFCLWEFADSPASARYNHSRNFPFYPPCSSPPF